MKNKKLNFLKLGILFFGISGILWNCVDEQFIETKVERPIQINAKTVSFKDAITHFNGENEKIKLKRSYAKNTENNIIIKPDWNSLMYNDVAYTNAKLTTAKTGINRDGNYSSELCFINVNNHLKNVIFTVWKDETDQNDNLINGRVFFNDLEGNFIDGYRIENGIFTKRYVIRKQIQKASFFSFLFFQSNDPEDFCWNTDTADSFDDGELDEVFFTAYLQESDDSTGGGGDGSGNYFTYGSYINGATFNGMNTNVGGGTSLSSGQITSAAAAILMTAPVDPDENGNCPDGYKKNPTTEECESICNGGKFFNETTQECECPEGMNEDASGKCVKKCETTKEDLKEVFPNTSSNILQDIADAINTHGKDFGIDTDEKLQHFISQAAHEATNPVNGIEFDTFEENLNYRWARLGTKNYWKKYFNTIANPTADPNKENPNDYKRNRTSSYVNVTKFANYVYDDANRDMGYKLGNTNIGDGYKYRGRGIFQLTGRSNYQQFNTFYRERYNSGLNFINNPDLLATDTEIAVISALWYYENKVNSNSITSTTSVEKVTMKINGGTKGIEHRKQLFNKTKNHINCN